MTSERIGDATIYTGDVLEVLRSMESESVHCLVTSPPYWGLRDYGLPPSVWDEPAEECAHEWGDESYQRRGGIQGDSGQRTDRDHTSSARHASVGAFCRLCGAWRGCHGLEPTPELYIQHAVAIFREGRRVLSDDGTAWVNIGDSYAGSGKGPSNSLQRPCSSLNNGQLEAGAAPTSWASVPAGMKSKDLVGIPWMLAFALRADGWYLRADIIWHKQNPMPESVTDRPTKAHEYVFLLSKSARYHYDAEAVREQAEPRDDERPFGNAGGNRHGDEGRTYKSKKPDGWDTGAGGHGTIHRDGREHGSSSEIRYGRNRRSVWTIATQPYKGAHFATFPRDLVKPCILAGCPEHVCPKCGAPWVREVEVTGGAIGKDWNDKALKAEGVQRTTADATRRMQDGSYERRDLGMHPTCACSLPAIPGTVLDPFGGSGTTAEVALEYGRRAILIELNPEYVKLIRERLRPVAGRPLLSFGGGSP